VKEKYILAVIEDVKIASADVITTSSLPDNLGEGGDHSSDGWDT
jgi:hypothetical protein